MRTRIRALLAATVLAGAGGLVAIAPATADNHSTLVDVTSSIESVPARVSPPGTKVLFPVTFTNVGPAPVTGGTVTVTLDAGFDVVFSSEQSQTKSSPSCVAPDDNMPTVVTCSWSGLLLAGQSEDFEVVAHTPTAARVYTTTSSASTTQEFEPLGNRGNNNDFATTEVLAANGALSAGLVEGGQSLEFEVAADGRRFKLTVPSNIPGVIVEELAAASGAERDCGGTALNPNPCGNGFILVFDETHETYRADDPKNPLVTERTFGKEPCNGVGAVLKCHPGIYYDDKPDDTNRTMVEMQDCTFNPDGSPNAIKPCIKLRYKTGGRIWFTVLMRTIDPLELPPSLL